MSFYVISQAAGGLSLYPGTKQPPPSRGMHDFACAVCFLECVVTEPEMFVRGSLNFLHRQKSAALAVTRSMPARVVRSCVNILSIRLNF